MRNDGVLKAVHGERFTPFALARKLNARVILESSSFQRGRERYSILLVREAFRVYQQESNVFFSSGGTERKLPGGRGDLLEWLRYFAGQHRPLHLDLPLPAGGIGYLSYEFAAFCDTIRMRNGEDELGLPLGIFLFGHIFIIFDHYTDILYIIGLNYDEHEIDLPAAITETEQRINDLDFNYLARRQQDYPAELLRREKEDELFLAGVAAVRQEVIKGNLLQGVLSRRLRIKTELPPMDAYKNLRSANPSPYLFYLDFTTFQLFGASPEVHVKVKDGKAVIRPIAGTRRRGASAEEDAAMEKELLEDEKERAEHLMLVDLARNDLGRVCTAGTVKMGEFMGIEHYSHVMHIVSEAEGTLAKGKTGADVIRATFPAGTVSGAPKIRAAETISALEAHPRSFYAGLLGYMEPEGNLDTCITIRSACKKDGIIYLQAGAGIVYDSVPERELEETNEKLRALGSAVGVEV